MLLLKPIAEENIEAPPEKKERPFYQPGWYKNLSSDEYHGSFGFSSSQLKVLCKRTPMHLNFGFDDDEDSTPLNMGSAVHTLVLEPHKEEEDIFVLPELNLRKPAHREIKEDLLKKHTGKAIVTKEEFVKAKAMANAVRSYGPARVLIDDIAYRESSVYWWYDNIDEDDRTPYRLMLKARPDAICSGQPVVIDLKTTRDASYTGFIKQIQNYYYHLSAAMYLDGINQCKPLLEELNHYAYSHFVFICVENFPPYATSVYELSPDYIDIGKALFRRATFRLHKGKESNWPGYPDEIRMIEPPSWAKNSWIV